MPDNADRIIEDGELSEWSGEDDRDAYCICPRSKYPPYEILLERADCPTHGHQ